MRTGYGLCALAGNARKRLSSARPLVEVRNEAPANETSARRPAPALVRRLLEERSPGRVPARGRGPQGNDARLLEGGRSGRTEGRRAERARPRVEGAAGGER